MSSKAITQDQQELIDFLIKTGHGWARYAKSVRDSGKCSDKQHSTLLNMVSRIEYKNNNKWRGEIEYDWDGKGDFYE